MLDLLRLRDKLKIVSAKHKRNNKREVKRYKCTFSGVDMCIGIITVILLGIKRFEKIDDLLHTETKLAQVIGLKRFFDKTYARRFLDEFTICAKVRFKHHFKIIRKYTYIVFIPFIHTRYQWYEKLSSSQTFQCSLWRKSPFRSV